MSNIDYRYFVHKTSDDDVLSFGFWSLTPRGKAVLKVVEYHYIQQHQGTPLFNLGFGDYDMLTRELNDESLTANKDVFKVFNTVLSTVLLFYKRNPDSCLLVQGSDGTQSFEEKCRQTCKRRCKLKCHNLNRRMRIYCNYVSKKMDTFQADYQFFGGIRNKQQWFDFEDFTPARVFDSILVVRKNS